MNALGPIFTAATECQDCYKCIRECPVKAIKVEGGYASIVPELCVYCGHCVGACPNGAKKVRNDRHRVRRFLARGGHAVVSLAPSWTSEFPAATPAGMIAALKRLGFAGVSETALGAQEVSTHVAAALQQGEPGLYLSSACPVVVEYVQKYRPGCAERITRFFSPMLAHARMLRSHLDEKAAVVFIGPCIAKKREADAHPDLVFAALTFEDLRQWFEEAGVAPEAPPPADGEFFPCAAAEGALFPAEGGMLACVEAAGARGRGMSFSGLHAVAEALAGIENMSLSEPLFLELLACEGGCINGPKTAAGRGTAARRYDVLSRARTGALPAPPQADITAGYTAAPASSEACNEQQIREVLRQVGKHTADDELNCGGCGYDSCRAFAAALLMGRAERRMCVTYMRKLAEKKSHALMQKLPSAVVIVDDALRILECNSNFARFFAEAETRPADLEGVQLDALVPFHSLFQHVLRTGEEVPGKDLRVRDAVYHVTVFSIEKHSIVGGIFRDETQPSVRKEQIIEQARQVIQKNLHTVQQIAYLMGENAAETEIALNSIVESFTPEDVAGDER